MGEARKICGSHPSRYRPWCSAPVEVCWIEWAFISGRSASLLLHSRTSFFALAFSAQIDGSLRLLVWCVPPGVIEIKADVETKHVEVICEDSVDPKDLLDVLLNWSSSSGKPVELLA